MKASDHQALSSKNVLWLSWLFGYGAYAGALVDIPGPGMTFGSRYFSAWLAKPASRATVAGLGLAITEYASDSNSGASPHTVACGYFFVSLRASLYQWNFVFAQAEVLPIPCWASDRYCAWVSSAARAGPTAKPAATRHSAVEPST